MGISGPTLLTLYNTLPTVLFCLASLALTAVTASIVCTDRNVGVLFAAPSPTEYYVCQWAGFAPTRMRCAPGTFFVERLQRCDAIPEGDNGNGGNGGGNGDTDGGNGGGGGGNGGAGGGNPGTNTPCPPCNPDTTPTPDKSNEVEVCPDDGFICDLFGGRLYPHPYDNTRYFLCPHENQCSVVRVCAHGTVFFEHLQRCDWPR